MLLASDLPPLPVNALSPWALPSAERGPQPPRGQIKRASLKSAKVDGLFHGPSFKCVLWRGLTTCPAKVKHRGTWKSIEKGTISPSTAHPERPRHSTYNHCTVNVDCSEEITVQQPKYRIISTSSHLCAVLRSRWVSICSVRLWPKESRHAAHVNEEHGWVR